MSVTIFNQNNNTKVRDIPVSNRFLDNKTYGSSNMFGSTRQIDNIINYISGQRWSVTYFSQYGDINDTLEQFDYKASVNEQRYTKINKLIMYVQTPIEADVPNEIKGESIINAGFIPKVNDCFIASLYGGKEALFNVDEVTHKHYNEKEIFSITYSLLYFLESDIEIYNTLIKRVKNEYVYDKDFLTYGNSPLLNKTDYSLREDLKIINKNLTLEYVNEFLDNETNMFLHPKKDIKRIDTRLVDYLYKVIDMRLIPNAYLINRLKSNDNTRTILDCIITRTDFTKNSIKMYLGWSTLTSDGNLNSRNLKYQGIKETMEIDKDKANLEIPNMNVLPITNTIITNDKIEQEKAEFIFSFRTPNIALGINNKEEDEKIQNDVNETIPTVGDGETEEKSDIDNTENNNIGSVSEETVGNENMELLGESIKEKNTETSVDIGDDATIDINTDIRENNVIQTEDNSTTNDTDTKNTVDNVIPFSLPTNNIETNIETEKTIQTNIRDVRTIGLIKRR